MIARNPIDDSTFITLGIVTSTAPRDALLAVLHASCPQSQVQLIALDTASVPHFRVEQKIETDTPPASIDTWLHIKGALMAAFPLDKPHAVGAIDL